MGDEAGELVEECLLGELDGFFKSGRDPGPLGLIKAGRELHEVVGRLDVGKIPHHAEEADEGLGVIRRVVERAQPFAGRLFELVVMPVEVSPCLG